MKIYTRKGDRGDTGFWGGGRTSKNHVRVSAYGEVDELNSLIGVSLASLPVDTRYYSIRSNLSTIQEELFVLGALLATPADKLSKLKPPFDKGLPSESVSRMEHEIDRLDKDLKPLKGFILPGGSAPGAFFHLARTVCRRAERSAVALAKTEPLPEGVLVYLNRLSDLLFVVARWVNYRLGVPETPWKGSRK